MRPARTYPGNRHGGDWKKNARNLYPFLLACLCLLIPRNSRLQTFRFVSKTSGHLFVRKNYNAPHPPGKSWSTIDRALQNGSQLFGAKHIVKTKTVSSKKRAENSSFGFSDGKRLSTEIRRATQFAPDSIRPY